MLFWQIFDSYNELMLTHLLFVFCLLDMFCFFIWHDKMHINVYLFFFFAPLLVLWEVQYFVEKGN